MTLSFCERWMFHLALEEEQPISGSSRKNTVALVFFFFTINRASCVGVYMCVCVFACVCIFLLHELLSNRQHIAFKNPYSPPSSNNIYTDLSAHCLHVCTSVCMNPHACVSMYIRMWASDLSECTFINICTIAGLEPPAEARCMTQLLRVPVW